MNTHWSGTLICFWKCMERSLLYFLYAFRQLIILVYPKNTCYSASIKQKRCVCFSKVKAKYSNPLTEKPADTGWIHHHSHCWDPYPPDKGTRRRAWRSRVARASTMWPCMHETMLSPYQYNHSMFPGQSWQWTLVTSFPGHGPREIEG